MAQSVFRLEGLPTESSLDLSDSPIFGQFDKDHLEQMSKHHEISTPTQMANAVNGKLSPLGFNRSASEAPSPRLTGGEVNPAMPFTRSPSYWDGKDLTTIAAARAYSKFLPKMLRKRVRTAYDPETVPFFKERLTLAEAEAKYGPEPLFQLFEFLKKNSLPEETEAEALSRLKP